MGRRAAPDAGNTGKVDLHFMAEDADRNGAEAGLPRCSVTEAGLPRRSVTEAGLERTLTDGNGQLPADTDLNGNAVSVSVPPLPVDINDSDAVNK